MIRRLVENVICFCFDWLEADWLQYETNGNWWHRVVGEKAQVLWFMAHNNRLYRWAITPDLQRQ